MLVNMKCFSTDQMRLLRLSIRLIPKESLAKGAISAAAFLKDKEPGIYTMSNVIARIKQMGGYNYGKY